MTIASQRISKPTVKRIVCLANAHKDGERCIAGKELLPDGSLGEWVRPVSRAASGALSKPERIYLDRTEPALLDIIEVSLDSPRPEFHQVENWLLTQNQQCKREGAFPLEQLAVHVDSPEEIWTRISTGHRDDRLPKEQADMQESSLLLIAVDGMEVTRGEKLHGKVRYSGGFQYGTLGYNYKFVITDPAFEERYADKSGKFWIEQPHLTISLTDVHQRDGYAYKLIAGVIESRNPR